MLAQVRCGYVTVPENRALRNGRPLRLAVAILGSTSATPRPDPIAFIQGGPGQQLVAYAPGVIARGSLDFLRADRDLVLFDQRGTGYSEPAFCPELTIEWDRIWRRGLMPDARRARQRDAAARCREVMLRARVDLSQYHAQASARDLEDIRRALGYEQWNLLGVSNGTRVALEAMRAAPHGIRSVTLDGPVPPNRSSRINRPADFVDVVRRLAAACVDQPACKSAYPEVEQSLWLGIEEMERNPFVVAVPRQDGTRDSIVVNGEGLARAVFDALYSRPVIAAVPLLVYEVRRRNHAVAAALGRQILAGAPLPTNRGLAFTVACFENPPEKTKAASQTSHSGGPAVLGVTDIQTDPSVCDALHPFRAGPEHSQPVVSDLPTLILTGEFDPATHRSNGPFLARTLSNSHVVEIPGAGHVESRQYECTRTIIQNFINEPRGKLDSTCLAAIPPLRFVTDVNAIK